MIEEHENNSAKYRDLVDVVLDQVNLALVRGSLQYDWSELKVLADSDEKVSGLKLLPSLPGKLELVDYKASYSHQMYGERDFSSDGESLALIYHWHFANDLFEIFIGILAGKLSVVTIEDEEKVEALLHAGLPLRRELQMLAIQLFQKSN